MARKGGGAGGFSMNCARVAVAMAALAMAYPARANDSTAELTTGGLVLAKTPDIEMRSEDLSISENEIVVRYRFFNRAAADRTVTVAFPMPDVVWEGPDMNVAIPQPESANFLEFHTLVDGREIAAQNEQKAIADGVDVTAKLRALGVPLAPQSEAAWKALDALAPEAGDELVKAGLAISDDYDAGKGPEHHLAPRWTFRSTFFWSQTFPAGREIAVEHRYVPSVGGSVGSILDSTKTDPKEMRAFEAKYCIDKAFLAGANAAIGARDEDGYAKNPLYEKRIAYVLKTGANWAAPIADFHLTIDKGDPAALISFCEDGVKKISPTKFEVRHANFTPARDLDILILYRTKGP
jgi:hypothetical protein